MARRCPPHPNPPGRDAWSRRRPGPARWDHLEGPARGRTGTVPQLRSPRPAQARRCVSETTGASETASASETAGASVRPRRGWWPARVPVRCPGAPSPFRRALLLPRRSRPRPAAALSTTVAAAVALSSLAALANQPRLARGEAAAGHRFLLPFAHPQEGQTENLCPLLGQHTVRADSTEITRCHHRITRGTYGEPCSPRRAGPGQAGRLRPDDGQSHSTTPSN